MIVGFIKPMIDYVILADSQHYNEHTLKISVKFSGSD